MGGDLSLNNCEAWSGLGLTNAKHPWFCVSDFSDLGSEASLEEVCQHHRIIKTQKQDDPDYLTLFEAHQRRLEDTGSPTQGQGWCE